MLHADIIFYLLLPASVGRWPLLVLRDVRRSDVTPAPAFSAPVFFSHPSDGQS